MHRHSLISIVWALWFTVLPPLLPAQSPETGESMEKMLEQIRQAESLQERAQQLEQIPEVLEFAREQGDQDLEMELLDLRYSTLQDMGQYQKVIDDLDSDADEWLQREKGYILINLLANAHTVQANYERALTLYQGVIDRLEPLGEERFIAGVQQNMGTAYKDLGDMESALSRFMASLELMEELGDRETESVILNNIGELYRGEEEYDMAREYLSRSLEVSREIDDPAGQSRALLNLGLVYREVGRLDEALEAFEESLTLAGPENRIRPIQVLYNRGMAQLDLGEHDKAQESFRQSLEMSMEHRIAQGAYYNHDGLGRWAHELGMFDQAAEHYEQALQVARQSGSLSMQEGPVRGLWEVYRDGGSPDQAIAWADSLITLTDSLAEMDQEEALSRYQVLLNVEDQKRANQLLEERLARQQQWILFVVGFLVLLAIVLGILYRNVQRQREMNRLLGERKKDLEELNREVADQRDQLTGLNRTKDRLISILAHDLRTPVTQLQALVWLIREEELNPGQREELLQQVDRQLSRSLTMLQEYLNWAKSQIEGIEPTLSRVVIKPLVTEVLDSMAPQADDKKIRLNLSVPEKFEIDADRQMLRVILQNLISNAIKFSDPGQDVSVELDLESDLAPRMLVRDSGVGIPEKVQKEIFSNPGNGRRGTDNEAGTGLGLLICQELAQKQGMSIEFESIPGEGSDFWIRFPKSESE
ncbi:MAG: tetratricopeptide repeat-containing sensor histidine kinase [Bacteroidota bacterium]